CRGDRVRHPRDVRHVRPRPSGQESCSLVSPTIWTSHNLGGMFRCVGHSMSGVGVLDKAVVILAACVDGASLAELVERTKLPRATAHRLAQALEIHRLLVRD